MAWYTRLGMAPRIIVPVSILLIAVLGTLTWQIQTRTSAATQEMARRELADLAHGTGRSHLHLSERCPDAGRHSGQRPGPGAQKRHSRFARAARGHAGRAALRATAPPSARGRYGSPTRLTGRDAEFKNTPGSDAAGRFIPYTAQGERVTLLTEYEKADYYLEPKTRKKPYLTPPYMYEVGGPDSAHDHGGGPGSGGRNIPGRRDR